MSHDRGCRCGRERWEYSQCPDRHCYKKALVAKSVDATDLKSVALERAGSSPAERTITFQIPKWVFEEIRKESRTLRKYLGGQ